MFQRVTCLLIKFRGFHGLVKRDTVYFNLTHIRRLSSFCVLPSIYRGNPVWMRLAMPTDPGLPGSRGDTALGNWNVQTACRSNVAPVFGMQYSGAFRTVTEIIAWNFTDCKRMSVGKTPLGSIDNTNRIHYQCTVCTAIHYQCTVCTAIQTPNTWCGQNTFI
jgi:hypothetical protein